MNVKLVDVARLAGVSTATVSRVINNSASVSEKVKQRVKRAIEEIGYRPSQVASYLASSKGPFSIGLIACERIIKATSTKPDEFYTVIFSGIEDFCRSNGMNYEVLCSKTSFEKFDGYLLIGGDITKEFVEELRMTKKPIVLIDGYIPGEKVDCVVSDGYDGAVHAVNYLLKNNMKRIVHINGPLNHYGFRDRADGYVAAMQCAGYMPKFYEFDESNDNMGSLIDLMLKSYGEPEGLFCCNDTAARRSIDELEKRGYRVPEDISVIGFDDIVSATSIKPALTTLKIFKYEMGTQAARRLFNLLIGQDTHPIKISLFTEFINRESTL